jgi:hypothetical protein
LHFQPPFEVKQVDEFAYQAIRQSLQVAKKSCWAAILTFVFFKSGFERQLV